MRTSEPRTVIDNTCCPVCGRGISSRMPRVDLRPSDKRHGLVVEIRVDSAACGAKAQREPDKFLAAAEINQVAG